MKIKVYFLGGFYPRGWFLLVLKHRAVRMMTGARSALRKRSAFFLGQSVWEQAAWSGNEASEQAQLMKERARSVRFKSTSKSYNQEDP